jgi:membrane associated rhomboid family serine protease
MTHDEGGNGKHALALWAGVTAFFTQLAAVGVIDLFSSPSATSQAIAGLITALIVAATVYSKQRWDDAKEAKARRHD